jgi:hypothetical protein
MAAMFCHTTVNAFLGSLIGLLKMICTYFQNAWPMGIRLREAFAPPSIAPGQIRE